MATVLLQLRKSFPRRGLAAYTPHYQGSGSNIPGLRGLGANRAGAAGRCCNPFLPLPPIGIRNYKLLGQHAGAD